jgi:drug/metabolite transporter (DMT)-like permease
VTTKQKAYIALSATSIIWGTTWVASKIGVQKAPALEVASIRQFIGGALYVVFFLVIKKLPLPTLKQLGWLTFMGILMFVSSNGIATMALKYVSSGLGALIAALYPLFVVLIEMIFYKNKKITALTFTGIILGIGGIGVVFYDDAFHNRTEGYVLGVILSLIAMITWSVATIFIARKKADINPYYATGWQMLISSVILFGMVLISGDHIPLSAIPAQTWGALAYLILAGSIFTFVAFIYSMKHLEPAIASLYAYINPIVAILVGSLVANEKLTITILVGSLITLSGVYLVNRSMKQKKGSLAASDADAM